MTSLKCCILVVVLLPAAVLSNPGKPSGTAVRVNQVMEGPLILQPSAYQSSSASVNATSDSANATPPAPSPVLWELAAALRHAVQLTIRPENYPNSKYVATSTLKKNANDGTDNTSPYRMSSFAVPRQETEDHGLDEAMERIVNDTTNEKEESQSIQSPLDDHQQNESVLVIPDHAGVDNVNSTSSTNNASNTNTSLADSEISTRRFHWPALPPDFGRRKASHEGDKNQQQTTPEAEIDVNYKGENMEADLAVSVVAVNVVISDPNVTESDGTTPRRSAAKITAYAPSDFAVLRSYFGLDEDNYFHSLLSTGPFVSFQSNSKGSARVGGVFFFTQDGTYLIKTIKRDEVGTLLEMLPKYLRYMKEQGRCSLLTRFCGMYEVEMCGDEYHPPGKRQTFVVMNSVFPPAAAKTIVERFDLKGSTLGRKCSFMERLTKGSDAVLKDVDLAREVRLSRSYRCQQNQRPPATSSVAPLMHSGFHIGLQAKIDLLSQLRKDVQFLVDCEVIDYSLLVGVSVFAEKVPTVMDLLKIVPSQGSELQRLHGLESSPDRQRLAKAMVSSIALALSSLLTPSSYIAKRIAPSLNQELPAMSQCGVDAGRLSHLPGERNGHAAYYYLGLIDFLQPFNYKKEIEWRWKRIRYGKGFSCVPPQEYAERFMTFMEQHIT